MCMFGKLRTRSREKIHRRITQSVLRLPKRPGDWLWRVHGAQSPDAQVSVFMSHWASDLVGECRGVCVCARLGDERGGPQAWEVGTLSV